MELERLIADRFEIDRPAGTGGMGVVYRAIDKLSGQPVALKLAQLEVAGWVERFQRECRVLAELSHPGIVRYVDHGRTPSGISYLAMEWLQGEDLEARLTRGPLRWPDALQLAQAAAEALGFAHEHGVVHRDVKPGNLFLVDGDIAQLKLLDFGVARLGQSREALTAPGAVVGTASYMAPEQVRADAGVDARSDVFALGCVLYECLTGVPAFAGHSTLAILAKIVLDEPEPISSFSPDVPADVEQIVARMLSKDPAARFQHGAELADELAAVRTRSLPVIERRSAPPGALGSLEQRLVSVVLAKAPKQDRANAATLTPEQASGREREVVEVAGRFGARVELLSDGSIVAGVQGAGDASEQAALAARCGLALRSLLDADIPMALATGRAVVTERLPIGEVIERADRVLRRAAARSVPSAGIFVDEVTAALLGERFELTPSDEGTLLRAERAGVEPVRRLLGKEMPCVGRAREIAHVRSLFEECVDEPRSRPVLLSGPAGIGKSRVRYELLGELSKDATVWIARADRMSSGSALGLAGQLVRDAVGLIDGDPLEARQGVIRAKVAALELSEESERVAAFLGELCSTPFDAAQIPQLRLARDNPVLLGDQMRRAFEDFAVAQCEQGPLVVVVEDLHWGDRASVAFLDSMLRHARELPLFLLAIARPEVHDAFPHLWQERGLQEIRLDPLGKRASKELLRLALGESVDDALVERLVERAQGNALFLEEVTRAAARGNVDALPSSLLAIVQARLELLDPAARRVLRAASVFGRAFWRGGVAHLLGARRPDEPSHWLEDLMERELVIQRPRSRFPDDMELVFRHELLREAAYSTFTDADRVLGHRLAATWLETAGETDARLLAQHWRAAERPDRERGAWIVAAEQALAGNDFTGAVEAVERALELEASGEELGHLLRLEAEARNWRGEPSDGLKAALRAIELLPVGSERWSAALTEAIRAQFKLGDREGLAKCATVLAGQIARGGLQGQSTVALSEAARDCLILGLRELGLELLAHAEQSAQGSAPATLGLLHTALAARALVEGAPAAYLKQWSKAAQCFADSGDVRHACGSRGNQGFAFIELGRYEEAVVALEEALRGAERMNVPSLCAGIRQNMGLAVGRSGDTLRGRELLEQARAAFREMGNPRMEAGCLVYLARISEPSDLETCERAAREAIEVADNVPAMRALARALLARVLLATGRNAEALEAAKTAFASLESLRGMESGEAVVRLAYAEALYQNGHATEGIEAIERARDRLLARADRIDEPEWRESFLTRIPEHARTISLAKTAEGMK